MLLKYGAKPTIIDQVLILYIANFYSVSLNIQGKMQAVSRCVALLFSDFVNN